MTQKFFILFLMVPLLAVAQSSDTEEKLLSRLEQGRQKTRTNSLAEAGAEFLTTGEKVSVSDDSFKELLREVEEMKARMAVEKVVNRATEGPERQPKIGSRTYYSFKEGAIYEVRAGIDKVTDISLEPGERITSVPVSGDTVRWKIDMIANGEGSSEVKHIIIKPLEAGIETNLIITTDRRVYHLRLVSSDWYMPQITWNYPENGLIAAKLKAEKENHETPVSVSPENINFNYEISGDDVPWYPERVFDDGAKTFIKMPQRMKSSEAPAFFVTGDDDEPILANYRVKDGYFIADRLFKAAQLRIGKDLKVEITRKDESTSFFGGLF